MHRYYFHVHDSQDMPDDEGTELPGDDAARATAVTVSGELLKELAGKFWLGSNWTMQVVRDDGEQVCELEFAAKTGQPAL